MPRVEQHSISRFTRDARPFCGARVSLTMTARVPTLLSSRTSRNYCASSRGLRFEAIASSILQGATRCIDAGTTSLILPSSLSYAGRDASSNFAHSKWHPSGYHVILHVFRTIEDRKLWPRWLTTCDQAWGSTSCLARVRERCATRTDRIRHALAFWQVHRRSRKRTAPCARTFTSPVEFPGC